MDQQMAKCGWNVVVCSMIQNYIIHKVIFKQYYYIWYISMISTFPLVVIRYIYAVYFEIWMQWTFQQKKNL